jgi:hypothetical protein
MNRENQRVDEDRGSTTVDRTKKRTWSSDANSEDLKG